MAQPKIYRTLVAVDVVVFGVALDTENERSLLRVLLIERRETPFKGQKVLPGGLLRETESLDDAAHRILREKTGLNLSASYLEQLYTMGNPKRDPRERSVAVTYMALVRQAYGAADANNPYRPEWCPIDHLLKLLPEYKVGFDHLDIIEKGYARLAAKARYAPIGFDLLPEKFTLGQLHRLYETILRREIDRRNFHKKILSLGIVNQVGMEEIPAAGRGRPARLYRFHKAAYNSLTKQGINFEI